MSFIAQRPVRPAESDVTDVDDGGAQIAIGTFWPTVKLHDLRWLPASPVTLQHPD